MKVNVTLATRLTCVARRMRLVRSRGRPLEPPSGEGLEDGGSDMPVNRRARLANEGVNPRGQTAMRDCALYSAAGRPGKESGRRSEQTATNHFISATSAASK